MVTVETNEERNSHGKHYQATFRVCRRQKRQVLGDRRNGKEVIVRFGRNGTTGQASTKSFANAEAAQKHAEKLLAEKLGKGYHEV